MNPEDRSCDEENDVHITQLAGNCTASTISLVFVLSREEIAKEQRRAILPLIVMPAIVLH